MRQVIFTADDFGLSEAVNEAVERAHRAGVLAAASLMVGAPAAADAVRRARAMPDLAVGLHLVTIEGPAVLPPAAIPALVGANGQFPSDQLGLGIGYAFHATARAQLAAEIRAQFVAFAATGLKLDHLNAHKHMHLHPTVGRLAIETGREFGLRAIRIPAEPPAVLARCGHRPGMGAHLLYHWTALLRRHARRAGLVTNDHCFGIAWSGHLGWACLSRLLPVLPNGTSEIYCHPAAGTDARLAALMPGYEQQDELAALLDPRLRALAAELNITLLPGYGGIARGR